MRVYIGVEKFQNIEDQQGTGSKEYLSIAGIAGLALLDKEPVMYAIDNFINIPDGELIQQANKGDELAFDALVKRYSNSLGNFIYGLTGDYDQMCDILQYVLFQLYLALPALRQGQSIKPWLFQVARNRCLDELRRKHMVYFSELERANEEEEYITPFTISDSAASPELLAEQHDLQRRLLQAIETLPPHFRAIVMLRYLTQWTFAEIGRALHIPEATARTYFQRAKPLLRASLSDLGPHGPNDN
jgi:RNA polymerase sigma factor (sigma-70 family)